MLGLGQLCLFFATFALVAVERFCLSIFNFGNFGDYGNLPYAASTDISTICPPSTSLPNPCHVERLRIPACRDEEKSKHPDKVRHANACTREFSPDSLAKAHIDPAHSGQLWFSSATSASSAVYRLCFSDHGDDARSRRFRRFLPPPRHFFEFLLQTKGLTKIGPCSELGPSLDGPSTELGRSLDGPSPILIG